MAPAMSNLEKFCKIKAATKQDELEVLVYGTVGNDEFWDDVTAKDFAEKLNENKDVKTINVRINSPGGSVFAGQAIYSMLKRHKADVNVYIDGLAASIASIIAMAGDTVYIPKNAMMMIHKPWSIAIGNSDEMRKEADVLDKVGESLVAAYQEKTGLKESEILQIMADETWYTGSEAVEKGFADVLEEKEVAACIKNDNIIALGGQEFDISNYKNFRKNLFAKVAKTEPYPEGAGKNGNKKTNSGVLQNNKQKGQKMIKELCAKLGVNYDAMIADGKTEDEIYQFCVKKMDESHKQASVSEQDRMKNILALGKEYNQSELALDFVQNGKTLAEFKDALLKAQKDSKPLEQQRNISEVGLSAQEARNFSILKLVNAMMNPTDRKALEYAKFELEACEAAAAAYGDPKNGGQIIPVEVLKAPLNIQNATGDVNTTLGGTLIPEQTLLGSFIELLRNKTVLMQLASKLMGLVGTVNIPNQTAGTTGYWVGEDTAPTSSQPTFSEIPLSMKTVGAKCRLTRSMRKQTTLDMEAMLRNDLATALGLAIDTAGFYGVGSAVQPKGIKYGNGINTVQFSSALPTFSELVKMETEIASDNADVAGMAYIFNAAMRGHCKTTQKFPTNTDGSGTIWEENNTVNGYNALVTNQVNAGEVFFGNFADLIIGMWGGLELYAEPDVTKGATLLTVFQDIDIAMRHAASFCFGSTSLVGTTGTTV